MENGEYLTNEMSMLFTVFFLTLSSWCKEYRLFYSPHFPCIYSYYMDGRVNKVEDFLKTRLLDTLTEQITKVTKVLSLLVV